MANKREQQSYLATGYLATHLGQYSLKRLEEESCTKALYSLKRAFQTRWLASCRDYPRQLWLSGVLLGLADVQKYSHAHSHTGKRLQRHGAMIVTVTSYKGGVGKTTTSIHLAAYLQRLAPTLLVDGDGIRSATKWSHRGTGHGLPFKVIPVAQMAKHLRDYEHVVIDTEGNPSDDDFRELAEGCDLMVIPAEPETVATDGLIHTLEKLQALKVERYKVLLTKVPPPPRTEGKQLREMLMAEGFPVFAPEIPRLAAFEKAAAGGVPVYDIKDERAARAWNAYEAVGKEITNG